MDETVGWYITCGGTNRTDLFLFELRDASQGLEARAAPV